MLKKLAETLCENFPESAAKLKAGKPLNKTESRMIIGAAIGFAACHEFMTGKRNAYVDINLSCGRVDRLFTIQKEVRNVLETRSKSA